MGIDQIIFLAGCLLATLLAAPVQLAGANGLIRFGGLDWKVKSGFQAPGPNQWDENNVRVDDSGSLHLRISHHDQKWFCAELMTTNTLGYGLYQFEIVGRVDLFDPNVVFGLFNYPTPEIGHDGTNEIDIEFSKWGGPDNPCGNYTVWPDEAGFSRQTFPFDFELTGLHTTHRIYWNRKGVIFQSLHGHQEDHVGQFAYWNCPRDADAMHLQKPRPLYMNLWLLNGLPPADNREVEVIVKNFSYIPWPQLKNLPAQADPMKR